MLKLNFYTYIWFLKYFYRFNRKPKKGVQFLQEQRLLGNTSAEIAEWLHTDDRLDKTGIGDFLGESDDFSKEVHT